MGLRSGIQKKPIPDPESRGQKAPDPGSGSATLAVSNPLFFGGLGCIGHSLAYVASIRF
jgi:hypothetical protein